MRFFAISVIVLSATAPVAACLWDRDTFAMEARGRLEVVETAVGWFDRFPPAYYQMRLDRVTPEIAADPKRLGLYDDAAVACDRLGKHDEAVAWMEKKGAAMQSLPAAETQDHRYRRLANLGVFHTHQWLKSADREKHPALLDQAIQDVEAALKINPNAHFGRERAHLALLEWWKEHGTSELSILTGQVFEEKAGDQPKSALIKGLCGLIQMGSAQESVDVHAILARQLFAGQRHAGDSHYSLSYLTCLRLGELLLDQKPSVHPLFTEDSSLQELMSRLRSTSAGRTELVALAAPELVRIIYPLEGSSHDASIIAKFFHEARAAAARRHADKTAFMLAQFRQGRHPDTHADFWDGWQEPPLPRLPAQAAAEKYAGLWLGGWLLRHKGEVLGGLVVFGVVGGVFIFLARTRQTAVRSIGRD